MNPALPIQPHGLPDVWRGRQLLHRDIPACSSGHAKLDQELPGGGWPLGALTELLTGTPGAGEFSLLMPFLASTTAQRHWVIMLDPPWVPYPPAMRGHGVVLDRVILVRTRTAAESLWACEQALRGVHGGAVLAWLDDPGFTQLRRLQLAAKAGCKAAFLFRPIAATRRSSPAALRLQVQAHGEHIRISILKCRGRHTLDAIDIRRPRQLPGLSALHAAEARSHFESSAPADCHYAHGTGSPGQVTHHPSPVASPETKTPH